ncbi:MAG: hypothetical protein ACKO3P_16115 [Planctomycetaceae bacterium]
MSETPEQNSNLETDERFPSGPWVGFFIQWGSRSRTELDLRFADGKLTGHGADWVGEFVIKGGYQTEDGKCWWSKRYVGGHDVFYQGYNEGRGIWGTWQIPHVTWRGGFHIWPKGQEEGEHDTAEEDIPLEELLLTTAEGG